MASGNFTVVFDACVLYPAALRDFLMTLATAGLFRAKWTDDIHDEWISALLERRPEIERDRLGLVRQKMDEAVPDALIERERYEVLIPSLSLPDENDRHVLAAAIVAGAEMIVTFNLSDFPPAALAKHAIEAVHPDDFVLA